MKGFFPTLLIVCGLLAAVWFYYKPYEKPTVDRFSAGKSIADSDRVIAKDKPVAAPAVASSTPASAQPGSPVASKPVVAAPVAAPVAAAPSPKSELEQLLEDRYPMPQILPLLTIVDQWRNVPPNAFPAEVAAKETIAFDLVINGQVAGSSKVAPGTPLKPVRLAGDQIVVASLANPTMSTQLPIEKTDFRERIEARYNQFVAAKKAEVQAKRDRARKLVEADPARLALLTGKAAAPAASDSKDDPRFTPVKESLRRGEAASVTMEEATAFRWNGSEKVGGEYEGSYDTVTVNFEVETIFGRFPTEYKALLKGGRVFAWIDPITEDRI
ncbi:MAG: hypothetical protein NWR21_02230 [Verrucomicrobiales bacterium]|jgi:hypothetical protein|nr:hypothetical protein [Verrucomicrobiales bacterium]MDP5004674.1 hypothetical protein [Verrucomicrobiales bacterium]